MARRREKIALVYGATGEIGRRIAFELSASGWNLAIVSRSSEKANALCHLLNATTTTEHQRHEGFGGMNFAETVREVESRLGTISACVNASGVVKDNLLLRLDESELNELMTCNLLQAIQLNKAVLKSMLKSESGDKSIVNIGSVVGSDGNRGQVAYSASKAGLHGLTKSLAKEVGSRGIRVNLVEPGFIDSKMTAHIKEPLNNIPLNRFGTAQDVAYLTEFLLSPKASYITGQILRVDGGLTL